MCIRLFIPFPGAPSCDTFMAVESRNVKGFRVKTVRLKFHYTVIQHWEQSMKLTHNMTEPFCKLKLISIMNTFHLLNNLKMTSTRVGGAVNNKQNIQPRARHDPCGRAVYRMGLRPFPWWDWVVRIPPGTKMPVSCECCVLSGRGVCDGPIIRPENSYRMWCFFSEISKPQWWGDLGPLQLSSRGWGWQGKSSATDLVCMVRKW